ncbi:MAG: fibronectin type III domain-containing protein, partial [Nitrospirota bacterium]
MNRNTLASLLLLFSARKGNMGKCNLGTLGFQIVLVASAALMIASNVWAGTAVLSWNPNSEPTLAGYRVYYGESRPYSQRLDVSNVTRYTVDGLVEGRTYYFAVTAYTALNSESVYSNEVSKTIPDTTPPQLSSIAAVSPSSSSASLSWVTNEPATSRVEFGLTSAYGASSPLDSTLVTSHRVTLQGLARGTMYHYRIISQDAAGNAAMSSDATFTSALTADTTPPVISAVAASDVTSTGATVTWTTNEPSESQVEYGTTTAHGSTTPLNITLVTNHSMTLSGLSPSTTYHFRVTSPDAAGNIGTSADFTFTTAETSRLTNLSTRGPVSTSPDLMYGGFIIGGDAPKTVLIRGRGPSLSGAPFNVPGTLANPKIDVYSGQTVIARNDNWQTTDPLCLSPATACGNASEIIATGRDPCQPNPMQSVTPPGCIRESAVLITLPPGPYSVIMSGVNGGTGVGLFGVTEMDASGVTKLVNVSTRGV